MFKGLFSLKILNLASNKISSIENNSFSDLKALEHLSLYKNKLNEISGDSFCGLNFLKELELQENSIGNITSAFSILSRLTFLNFLRNPVTYIEPHAFKKNFNFSILHIKLKEDIDCCSRVYYNYVLPYKNDNCTDKGEIQSYELFNPFNCNY
jgi:Leucine-rich repeat (LRR) protein